MFWKSWAFWLNKAFVNRYAQYGDVSPKVDVYAFGVVLYELISAMEAVVKTNASVASESKGLVALVAIHFLFHLLIQNHKESYTFFFLFCAPNELGLKHVFLIWSV